MFVGLVQLFSSPPRSTEEKTTGDAMLDGGVDERDRLLSETFHGSDDEETID